MAIYVAADLRSLHIADYPGLPDEMQAAFGVNDSNGNGRIPDMPIDWLPPAARVTVMRLTEDVYTDLAEQVGDIERRCLEQRQSGGDQNGGDQSGAAGHVTEAEYKTACQRMRKIMRLRDKEMMQ